MNKTIIINSSDLNSVIYKDLCSINELLSKSYNTVKDLVIPPDFLGKNEIKNLEHQLSSCNEKINDYKEIILKTIKEIEKMSIDTTKKINGMEKVEVSKATK